MLYTTSSKKYYYSGGKQYKRLSGLVSDFPVHWLVDMETCHTLPNGFTHHVPPSSRLSTKVLAKPQGKDIAGPVEAGETLSNL